MTWLLLALWWVVLPAVPEWVWLHWLVHLVVVSVLALLTARQVWAMRQVRLSVPVVATLAASASLLVAMHVSPDRFPTTERWWEGMTGLGHALFFLVALVMVPLSTADGGDETDDEVSRRFRALLSVLLVGVLVAQVAVVLRFDLDAARIAGGLGNPNTLGALVAAFALALAGFGRWKPSVLLLLSALVVLVVLTRSRGAAASGALVLLAFTARRNWRWVVGLGALLGVALVTIPNPLWERMAQLETEHYYSRPFLWHAALQNIAEHPLGIGPAMNRYVFPLQAFDPVLPWLLHQRHAVGLTHNVFLTLTLEWGWLAGAAGLGLALWTLRRIWPRLPPDPLRQGATLGALVLFCELQIDGLEQNAVVFSMFLLFTAIAIRRAAGAGRGPVVPGRVAAVLLVAAGLGLVSQAVVRTGRVAALHDVQVAWRGYQAGQVEEADVRAALDRAEGRAAAEEVLSEVRFQFETRVFLRALRSGAGPGPGERDLALLEDNAWTAARQARERNPADPGLAKAIADFAYRVVTEANGDDEDRARYFEAMRRLLAVDPLDVTARRQLAREYASDQQLELMEATFDELFDIEPDDAASWVLRGRYRMLDGDLEGALYAYVRAQEAVFNCRVKAAVPAPRSREYFVEVLRLVDLNAVRRRIAELRRELYR